MPYIQFQFRRDTSTNWTTNNPTLAAGEIGLETDSDQFKVGDGTTAWTGLDYGGIQGPTYGSKVVTVTDTTSITPNADTTDIVVQNNTQSAGTLTINAPTGTISNGQRLLFQLTCTNAQTFSFNAAYIGSADLSLPGATTGSGKTDYVGFIYYSSTSKWHILAKNFGF